MTFNEDGSVIFSSMLTDDEKLALNITENIQINISQGMEPYRCCQTNEPKHQYSYDGYILWGD